MEQIENSAEKVGMARRVADERLWIEAEMRQIRETFESHAQNLHAGSHAVLARSAAVDKVIAAAWKHFHSSETEASEGVALFAVGGYGRQELFPYSDVDLMFLLDQGVTEKAMKEPIRRLNQALWDIGLRVSTMSRTVAECGRFDAENVEFTLALLDARVLAGDLELAGRLTEKIIPKMVGRDWKKISTRLLEVTRVRHARSGHTLFHLEPNVKECPGGLRDVHVCEWLARLDVLGDATPDSKPLPRDPDLVDARKFLVMARVFLHFRHGRDDNALDWQAQDEAATLALGTGRDDGRSEKMDAAYWMRLYFRHARVVERCAGQFLDEAATTRPTRLKALSEQAGFAARRMLERAGDGNPAAFEIRQNRIWFTQQARDPEDDPEAVLSLFAVLAQSGASLSSEAARRIGEALPVLSSHLEDGPNLWRRLQSILLGRFAGKALRGMHALGMLELVIPEFHGIDALVIRDAYHRYTVDEHTFVLIDILHALRTANEPTASGLSLWAAKFGGLFRDLPHPELLLLASLLHDTGKGHALEGHALASARMAADVLGRLELDGYETGLVLDLITNHLEMSAALRRDVFDHETIRSFALKVPNPEALRMLTLFTFCDIAAVHPDALTPWKAENLWRLYNATTTYLDRNVDEERVAAEGDLQFSELLLRIHALLPQDRTRVNTYLEGFPRRYLQTRTPESVQTHMRMAWRLEGNQRAIELEFRHAPGVSEITLITNDRPALFATIAGALAGWGMNIVTADAFSNAHGVVVDSFRFTDVFRTLELNESEKERFTASIRDVVAGKDSLDALLASRRRGRRKIPKVRVETRMDFDQTASSHSTLLQVVAQDTPGLLRTLSLTLAEHGCNIEVALVDTEGETAIDVFYVRRAGAKLEEAQQEVLRAALSEAIDANV